LQKSRLQLPNIYYEEELSGLKETLEELSRKGMIWLSRYGYGATESFKRALRKEGTIRLLDKISNELTALQRDLLNNLLIQGVHFTTFDSFIKYQIKQASRESIVDHWGALEADTSK